MLEFVRQLWLGAKQAWTRLTVSARINIGLAVLATLSIIAALVISGAQPQYVNLYSGLENAEEVGKMQALLKEEGILYKMADMETTIRVRDTDASRARMVLSAQKLPTRYGLSKGWELLDETNMFTSPDQREDNRKRAIQGELQRQLNELDFIEQSVVFINFAKESLIKKNQAPSEAAVTITTNRPPTEQEKDAMLGIISAFGGANLDRNHITLVTSDGIHLNGPKDEVARLASNKQDQISKWEREREKKIDEVFQKIGKKATVTVSAKLDFSIKKTQEERVEEGAPISAAETTSNLSTEESLPQGPPGVYANAPEGSPGPTSTKTVEKTNETITNNDPSRTKIETTTEPGDITGYKVSAIIDGNYEAALDESGNPTGEKKYIPLNEKEISDYQLMIANAVGTEAKPEDVFVMSQAFQIDQLQEALATTETFAKQQRWNQYGKYGLTALKVLLVAGLFLYIRRLLFKLITPPVVEVEEEKPIEISGPSQEEMRKRAIAEEVENLSQQQPEIVASLLRAWMSESED